MRLVDQRKDRDSLSPSGRLDEQGFIMVALLVGIAVSAIWMAALLPSWTQQETRERELELIFRGEQYARAIYLYRQKNQAPPPDMDTLVNQRFLRKKYVDPITGKDFIPVGGVTAAPAGGGAQGGIVAPGRGGIGAPQVQAGMTGVRSTSNDTSIILYQNQQTYSQFPFDWTQEAQRAGRAAPPIDQSGRGGPARGQDGRGVQGGINQGRTGSGPGLGPGLGGGPRQGSGPGPAQGPGGFGPGSGPAQGPGGFGPGPGGGTPVQPGGGGPALPGGRR